MNKQALKRSKDLAMIHFKNQPLLFAFLSIPKLSQVLNFSSLYKEKRIEKRMETETWRMETVFNLS
jgi:hypothetical protein